MIKVSTAFIAACVAALAWAASGLSEDTPALQLYQAKTGLNATADVELDFTVPSTSAATAKLVIYAPAGVGAKLGQAPATKVADAAATVDASGTQLSLQGQVVADSPANYVSDPRAQACAPGTHAAVWVIQLPTATRTLAIPIFVDPTSGSETSLGSYKLQACFASPYVPEAQGGAPFGAKILEADVNFEVGTFTNPGTAGIYVWRAFATPYATGTATPNPAGTYELRTDAFIPAAFTLRAHWDRKKHTAVISGRIKLAGISPSSFAVGIIGSSSADLSRFRLIGVARVRKGVYTLRKKLKKTTYMVALLPASSGQCDPQLPTPAPAGCALETTVPVLSNRAKLVVPKKR